MKALSIRQPWAWLIIHGGKDIENRDWKTQLRGRILVHASKGMTRREYEDAMIFAAVANLDLTEEPGFDFVNLGGIVGSVEIVDCVEKSDSRWFQGRYGFVLRDPRPMIFRPMPGKLGFFDAEISLP